MPKGHPRCPECHGAGGRTTRTRGGNFRWVRCKCVPSTIDDNSRLQSLTHVKHEAEGDNPVSLRMAVEVAIYCGVTEEQLKTYMMDNMTAHAWVDAQWAYAIIQETYKEKDNGHTNT